MSANEVLAVGNVFIGIPTLNRPGLVRETIRSILNQTYSNYRVIVSDNVSEGGVAQAVEDFVEELGDSRVSFHRQAENVYEYGQGRYFFQEAAGHEYFVILHDDDILDPDYLKKGVAALEQHRSAAVFVANPSLIDAENNISSQDTKTYLAEHGRAGRREGEFDVLSTHLAHGFAPISGTLFRRAALEESGFVDEDCHGNYPFECNIFLRLGECGAKGWFMPEQLLSFRFHKESMRNYIGMMESRDVVDRMIRLFGKRRFSGANERRRKVILSRLYRAKSWFALRDGDRRGCRDWIFKALYANIRSPKAWALAPLLLLMPGSMKQCLSELPAHRETPKLPVPRG